jgi:hypothetical protein
MPPDESENSAVVETPPEPPKKRGRGRPPIVKANGNSKVPRVFNTPKSAYRTDVELFAEIEKRQGENTDPSFVMILLRSHRALEATNRAQREVIHKLGDELKALKVAHRKGSR